MDTTNRTTRLLRGAVLVGAPLGTLLAIASPLVADGVRLEPVRDAVAAKECSACHMLYPAGLLPARSWRRMTATLADHFGDNAGLDDPTAARIAGYLAANAADAAARNRKMMRDLAADVTPVRITELPWWKRKHERKDRVTPATLARKNAQFKGDCKACHEDAERGLFDDD